MSFRVTQRKRGGFEYTSVAETEAAALVLATMMRRAGDEYCREAAVTVCNGTGAVVAAWRGGNYGWTPVPLSRPAAVEAGLQPLVPRAHAPTPTPPTGKRRSGPFARMPTEPMASGSQVSMAHQSYASISITDYSAVSVA
jgi:hypothetical protein